MPSLSITSEAAGAKFTPRPRERMKPSSTRQRRSPAAASVAGVRLEAQASTLPGWASAAAGFLAKGAWPKALVMAGCFQPAMPRKLPIWRFSAAVRRQSARMATAASAEMGRWVKGQAKRVCGRASSRVLGGSWAKASRQAARTASGAAGSAGGAKGASRAMGQRMPLKLGAAQAPSCKAGSVRASAGLEWPEATLQSGKNASRWGQCFCISGLR